MYHTEEVFWYPLSTVIWSGQEGQGECKRNSRHRVILWICPRWFWLRVQPLPWTRPLSCTRRQMNIYSPIQFGEICVWGLRGLEIGKSMMKLLLCLETELNWGDVEEGGLVFGEGKFSLEVGDRWSLKFPPWLYKDLPHVNTLSAKMLLYFGFVTVSWAGSRLTLTFTRTQLSHSGKHDHLLVSTKTHLCYGHPQHRIFLARVCTYLCTEKIQGWQGNAPKG